MGGYISVKMSLQRPSFYKGMGLIVPYFRLPNQDEVDKQMGMVRLLHKFWPTFNAPVPADKRKALKSTMWLREVTSDPMVLAEKIPINNLIVNEKSFKRFREKEAE
jgi:hypothetical protein